MASRNSLEARKMLLYTEYWAADRSTRTQNFSPKSTETIHYIKSRHQTETNCFMLSSRKFTPP